MLCKIMINKLNEKARHRRNFRSECLDQGMQPEVKVSIQTINNLLFYGVGLCYFGFDYGMCF